MIEFRTLGTLILRGHNGQDLHPVLAQPKRIALLAYLALARPRGFHRRDTLLALLWPEQDDQHARWALNQALRHLRTTLGKEAVPSRGEGEVGIDPRVLSCDAVEFQVAIEADDLVRALDLYRGDLLEGFHVSAGGEFERWLEEERVWLRLQAARAAAALASREEARGEPVAAGHWARRAFALAPGDEGEVRNLIELLGRLGDRAGAVQAYEEFARRLRVDFEVDPAPETLAAINAVRTRQPAPAPSQPTGSPDQVVPEPEPAVAGPPPGLPGRRRRRWVIPGFLGLVALGAIALLGGLYRSPQVPSDADLLAVAPFEVLEPSLQVWREGMVDVLSRTLDGAGPIRTVSPTVVLRRWSGRADRASAEELGRRTGAGLAVYGAVVGRGRDSVTLRAALLDRVGGIGKAEIEVSGEYSRIGQLADSLGIRILQVLGQSRTIGSVRQVSMGSRSLEALKAFLQGEQFYRRGLWDSAMVRYDQAVDADSTFALALSRMKWTMFWDPPTAGAYLPPREYARRSTLYNHGLSPPESLQIVADSFKFAANAATEPNAYVDFTYRSVAALEEAVRRYPGDPHARYALGEIQGHSAPPLRAPPATTFETFSRAIALDSGFAPAYEHMPDLALQLGRPDLARRYAAAYVTLHPDAGTTLHVRLALMALDPTQSGALDTARVVDSASVNDLWRAALDVLWYSTDSAESQIKLLRKLSDPHRSAGGDAAYVNDSVMWPQYLAVALAFRGRVREAYQTNRRLLVDPTASPWSLIVDPFLDLALLGVIPDSIAGPVFARALEPNAPWEGLNTPRHLAGPHWWLARGDTASLARFAARAAEESREPNPPLVILRARLLGSTSAAYADLARGDTANALAQLEAIPDTLCIVDHASDCFHQKLTLARLLAARGDDRRAGTVLERWRWALGFGPATWFVLGTLEHGRVAERLGEREKAIASYRFVTEAWRRADPELQPYVSEAREALARLVQTE